MATQDAPRPLQEVRTAYADAGKQRDTSFYSHDMRCLSFLTSVWVSPTRAGELVEQIGGYNRFTPDALCGGGGILEAVADADPDARVAVGREGSPVLYVETTDAAAVLDAFSVGYSTEPDELSEVDPGDVGSARKDLYGDGEDQIHPHSTCNHEAPPVPVDEYAPTRDGREYVRAWWD
jgi:hypothetical protein